MAPSASSPFTASLAAAARPASTARITIEPGTPVTTPASGSIQRIDQHDVQPDEHEQQRVQHLVKTLQNFRSRTSTPAFSLYSVRLPASSPATTVVLGPEACRCKAVT